MNAKSSDINSAIGADVCLTKDSWNASSACFAEIFIFPSLLKYSPEIDFVFTVFGSAAEETCPVWRGEPLSAHWGIDDPAAKEGTASVRMQAFQHSFSQMYQRIELFLNLPIHSLERLALKKELVDIGKIQ